MLRRGSCRGGAGGLSEELVDLVAYLPGQVVSAAQNLQQFQRLDGIGAVGVDGEADEDGDLLVDVQRFRRENFAYRSWYDSGVGGESASPRAEEPRRLTLCNALASALRSRRYHS